MKIEIESLGIRYNKNNLIFRFDDIALNEDQSNRYRNLLSNWFSLGSKREDNWNTWKNLYNDVKNQKI